MTMGAGIYTLSLKPVKCLTKTCLFLLSIFADFNKNLQTRTSKKSGSVSRIHIGFLHKKKWYFTENWNEFFNVNCNLYFNLCLKNFYNCHNIYGDRLP